MGPAPRCRTVDVDCNGCGVGGVEGRGGGGVGGGNGDSDDGKKSQAGPLYSHNRVVGPHNRSTLLHLCRRLTSARPTAVACGRVGGRIGGRIVVIALVQVRALQPAVVLAEAVEWHACTCEWPRTLNVSVVCINVDVELADVPVMLLSGPLLFFGPLCQPL